MSFQFLHIKTAGNPYSEDYYVGVDSVLKEADRKP